MAIWLPDRCSREFYIKDVIPRNFSANGKSWTSDELSAISEKIFAVGFETQPLWGHARNASITDGLKYNVIITTTFKDTPTCKGSIPMHRCSLRLTLVDYAVMIKNDSITLQYPHWQSDMVHETSIPKKEYIPWGLGVFTNEWTQLFALLYPPTQINVTQMGDRPMLMEYVLCQENSDRLFDTINTTCPLRMPIIRDLSKIYSNQPLPYRHACDYTWRDPMQVTSPSNVFLSNKLHQ